ncbi:MAG: hypothetical protein JJE25_02040 [Bacteroidia bacterium]|nr:hypothetical protein [Bacteroidia bacterium]
MKLKASFYILLNLCLLFLIISGLYSFTEKKSDNPSKTILLIPYQTVMHLSDADADIAEYSKINVRQVRVKIRNSVTEQLSLSLRENYLVRMLTESGTKKERNDLDDFLSAENFHLGKIDAANQDMTADTSRGNNPYFSFIKKNNSTDYNSSYMNVSFSKPVFLQKLANNYEADYFVVLTQFEIKTHYNECIDVANRIFRREFRLHYAVFDAGGNPIGGSYASSDADSDMNSVNKITGNIFPELVKKVCDKVALSIK